MTDFAISSSELQISSGRMQPRRMGASIPCLVPTPKIKGADVDFFGQKRTSEACMAGVSVQKKQAAKSLSLHAAPTQQCSLQWADFIYTGW